MFVVLQNLTAHATWVICPPSFFFKGCAGRASINVLSFNLQSKSLNKLQKNSHCLSRRDEQSFHALHNCSMLRKQGYICLSHDDRDGSGSTNCRQISKQRKELGPAAFWERQHLGTRGAPGPTLARSHSFTQGPGITCRLIGTVLPAEEEGSPAGFLPAHRVSNLGTQSTVLHASPEKLPTLTWKQGQANLYSSSQE